MDCQILVGGGNYDSWLDLYGYTTDGLISNLEWLNRAKEKNTFFANGWHIFTDFSHLQNLYLRFLDGVIWEDVLYAELLFAQSKRIAILPQRLVHYRVRQNNTSNFSGVAQKNLPPFVKPLQRYFDNANEAWAYFSAFSWCEMANEFVKFCETYSNKGLCERLKECFLGHLLCESSAIMDCKSDPKGAKIIFAKLIRRFGKKYLPKDKRHFRFYNVPILWHTMRITCNFYENLKNLERKIRRWRKGIFKKHN